jgi:integrase
MTRQRNDGVRKICGCRPGSWPKCRHPWHINFKHGGHHYRFSLDKELGRHVDGKTEARAEAERIRGDIRAGRFRTEGAAQSPEAAATIEQLGRVYFARYVSPKTGKPLLRNEQYRWDLMMRTAVLRMNGARVRFGDLAVTTITRHDVEAFAEAHRTPRTETFADAKGRKHPWKRGGLVSVNRCLGRLRAFYNWAIENGHLEGTPFKRHSVTVVRLFKESERERRLQPGAGEQKSEEDRIVVAANPHLRALITAALETGCRVGELLSLQWHQVRWDLNEIHLPSAKTKARRPRDLPMSQRLRAVLEMRRHGPDGGEYPVDAYVFGDETGARVKSVKTAWWAACRKAGISGLTFHDLRREAGSRLLEGGVPPNIVQAFLDHANISTTSRYLKVTRQGMHAALKRFEAARERCNLVASEPNQSTDARESIQQPDLQKPLQ